MLQSEPRAELQRLCRSASGRAGSLLMQHFAKGNFLHPPPSRTSPLRHPSAGGCAAGSGSGGAEGRREPAGSCGFKGAAEPALPPRRRAPPAAPASLRSLPGRPPRAPAPGRGSPAVPGAHRGSGALLPCPCALASADPAFRRQRVNPGRVVSCPLSIKAFKS